MHGPEQVMVSFASVDDRAACRTAIRGGSKAFYAASLLLPQSLRDDAYALYAFCRMSDDLIDLGGGADAGIASLRRRLERAYAGNPEDDAVDRCFADAVRRHRLPVVLPSALIDGLAWDVDGVICETLSDVFAYGARVAGAVGAMMAVLMGARSEAMVARACDLGVAMQLTNIARDVGEDARAGRLYLPRSWLREQGIDPEAWLRAPAFGPEIGRVVARLLSEADRLYRRSDSGIAGLPAACRPGIFAARHLYCAIGEAVAARGYDSVTARARVHGAQKAALIAQSIAQAALAQRLDASPPLAETAFLVDAVTSSPEAALRPVLNAERSLSGRIVWVAELFASLDQRERSRLAPGPAQPSRQPS